MEMGKDEERKEQQGVQRGGHSEDRLWEGQIALHQLLRWAEQGQALGGPDGPTPAPKVGRTRTGSGRTRWSYTSS